MCHWQLVEAGMITLVISFSFPWHQRCVTHLYCIPMWNLYRSVNYLNYPNNNQEQD